MRLLIPLPQRNRPLAHTVQRIDPCRQSEDDDDDDDDDGEFTVRYETWTKTNYCKARKDMCLHDTEDVGDCMEYGGYSGGENAA